jgi:hypothetical protein
VVARSAAVLPSHWPSPIIQLTRLHPDGLTVASPDANRQLAKVIPLSRPDMNKYHPGKQSTHYNQRCFTVNHEGSGLYGVRNIVAGVINFLLSQIAWRVGNGGRRTG